MAIADQRATSDGKILGLFKLPFRNPSTTTSSSSGNATSNSQFDGSNPRSYGNSNNASSSSVSSVARSLLPTRRRLRLDPSKKLYFPYMIWIWMIENDQLLGDFSRVEPGKQVQSAIRIKNTSKSHVAFKFQTTAPKSCFMRPPGAILTPGESLIATVFKFVEPPENGEKPLDPKTKVKFKIMSLKVKGGAMDYAPELFDEQKDQSVVEQILRVVFLDVERPTPALEKLKRQLAEAEAALEARKKPPEDTGPKIIGEGLVIDEWKERRERYLARQQVEGLDSV
ncbi:hypothetical protein RHSIM_Rhsim02G0119300 [Rhododendron simsii]|uniref:MSP domain-containing protein n=1 Tax=Rhododendron simsii TaxID=118357 RepID=A0A834HBT4_RHOSS|nr:hypothetical protein RHSIM_Rhsim02G0119300 [Rhododendron simsii]